jgi:four helix bundle protein
MLQGLVTATALALSLHTLKQTISDTPWKRVVSMLQRYWGKLEQTKFRFKIKDLRFKRNMENEKIKDFKDLIVWQEGHQLVIQVYKLTKSFPREELYSLSDQIKRAVSSVTSNIAEGFGRHTYKEKIQFYYQAQGSLIEVKNQLIIAKDVGFVGLNEFDILYSQANKVHSLLQGLIRKSKTFLIHKS